MKDYISRLTDKQIEGLRNLIGFQIKTLCLKSQSGNIDRIDGKLNDIEGVHEIQLIFNSKNIGVYLNLDFHNQVDRVFHLTQKQIDTSGSLAEFRRYMKEQDSLNLEKVANQDWEKFPIVYSIFRKLERIGVHKMYSSFEYKGENYLHDYILAFDFQLENDYSLYLVWSDIPNKYLLSFNDKEWFKVILENEYFESKMPPDERTIIID